MSNPVFTAAVLVEANGAALNNAGDDTGQRLANAVVVKQVRVGRDVFPYVSGQAVRRWWREVLYSDFAWAPSPVTRTPKSAFTAGDPVAFPDDDLFGYMAARKAAKKTKKNSKNQAAEEEMTLDEADAALTSGDEEVGGTQKRISPLKNSLLVSVLPDVLSTDFGHFSRGLPVETPNYVPFEHQHYTTLLQGAICLSLSDVGRFECGAMRDLPLNAAVPAGVTVAVETDNLSRPRVLALSVDERKKRISEVVLALGRLRYGANLTRDLSDVSPVVILMGFLDGGNAPFQNLFSPSEKGSKVVLNLPRLRSVITDYADRIIGTTKLYFGYRPGVLANEAEVLEALQEGIEGVRFEVSTPGKAIKAAADAILKNSLVPEEIG